MRIILTLLEKLNNTPLKRVLIYFALAYPIATVYFFKDEVKLLLFNHDEMVTISDIAIAQKKCFDLRTKYHAETVMLYVYQPVGSNKTHKERMVFSTGSYYQPIPSMQNVNLYSRGRILEDLRKQNYVIITPTSKHEESSILITYDLAKYIITPVIDQSTGMAIGEVIWLFKTDIPIDIDAMITDSQAFSILINDKN
jgi:hypothetical protein